ncbi:MAG TPA: insulinase family protein [Longimicrobium sp.]|jgi:zinc protease|nr:insulinase family protein [Longimicrobium sp.]
MTAILQLRRALALAAGAAALGAAPAAAQKQPPPPPAPARPLAFPAFRETRLPNGMSLVVVENHRTPLVSMYLLVRSGNATVPAAKAGTASLVADVLTRGTATRSASQIAQLIEGSGGSLNAFSSDDYTGVAATVLSDRLPLAFELVADVALHPIFPDSEVETARQQSLSQLQAQLGQPGSLASRRFYREVYGPHPYGILRTPESVRGLTARELRDWHAAHFKAGNAMLVVAGDVSQARAEALARERFGGWERGNVAAPAYPPVAARARTGIVLIHRPGSVQSTLFVGNPGMKAGDPDYYAVQVMTRLLGGGSDARLFQVLREQHGWTYGAYANADRPIDTGLFFATADVRTEVTDSALAELVSQLRRLRDEPVPAPELEAAKSYLVGSFPVGIETATQVAVQVATTRVVGLPIEDLLLYNPRVQAVTAADVQRVARRFVHPDQATIVVVGDAAKVLPGLERIAPVTLVDLEGKPLERSALEVRASAEHFDYAKVAPSTLAYQVAFQGNPVGSQTVALARDGDGWTRTNEVQFGPVHQALVTRFGPGFAPISHTETVTGPAAGTASVALTGGRFRGEAKLPPQMGGEKTYDVAAVPGAVLEGMDEVMLGVADLAQGKTIAIPQFNTGTGSVDAVSFRVTGVETVTVPAGTFPAFRVEVAGKQAPMVVWLRQAAPHVPLKYEITGQPVVIQLQSIQ